MTEIKIKSLILENFKCHGHLELNLMGGNASIYGDNATGKTSIYDALTWLLFGKDSLGNGEKNIEIKPLDASGEVRDHLAVTSVEAVLLVNGEEVALKRTYQEVWTTRRGSSEAVYGGNTSEYYVDGIPCKRNAFQSKVGELVTEETFRMLTSVSYFAKDISWQERRGVLFRVAGVMDDAQILATDQRFQPLIEGMGRHNLEDYKKKLLAEKRGYVGARTEIPARISECQKTIDDIQGLDFGKARTELAELEAQRDTIASRILAIENDSAAGKLRNDIRSARLDLEKLESENRSYRASQSAGAVDVDGLKRVLAGLKVRLSSKQALLEGSRGEVTAREQQITNCREKWLSVNAEVFSGGACPTCGQVLPAAQLQAAADKFEVQKRTRLRDVERMADTYKEGKTRAEARVKELEEEIQDLESQIGEAQAAITAAEGAVVEVRDMEGYQEKRAAVQAQINGLSDQLQRMMNDAFSMKEQLRQELAQVKQRMAACNETIQKESLLAYSRQRIEALRQDARSAAERLEAIEKMLDLMDAYSRYKTRFVEDSINGLFRIARFRLFREQANGGIEDRCDVVLDGVPYISINNGAKINVGIDIINTLSRAYGVSVPLFVDNAESVTRLESSASQIIRLVVSENDKELRVSYAEN